MTAAATAAQTLRFAMIVLYHGSIESERGQLFRISGTRTVDSVRRYDLISYYGDPGRKPVLVGAHAESVTRVLTSQIKTVKCRTCHIEYTSVPAHGINTDGCPLCALPDPVL